MDRTELQSGAWPEHSREVQHVPKGGATCPGLRQGSCHGAYVIRKWWEFGSHPHPQGLEFQKGSKVNLPQALTRREARKASGGRAEIVLILSTGQAEPELERSHRAEEVQDPRAGETSKRAFRPTILASYCAWASEACHLLTPAESRLGGL